MTATTERLATNGQPLGRTGIKRSQKFHALAPAFESWTEGELCEAYGFRRDSWYDHDGKRTIELLGPDSPGEYCYTFPLWRLEDEHVQSLLRDLVLWVDARGKEYTGSYAPGVVPDEYRTGD